MKISNSLHEKGNKLNEYICIPLGLTSAQKNKISNLTFHRQKSRLCTAPTQTPPQRQHSNSSFYDNFEFVDRLTNNKMVYRDARKSSNSLLQFRKTSTRLGEKPIMSSLLHVYKRTKDFEMKSLKKKIFKNFQNHNSNNEVPIKTLKLLEEQIPTKPSLFRKENRQNTQTTHKSQQQTAIQLVQRSRKKNKLRSFIDKTIMDMNRGELQRIVTENDASVNEEILLFNSSVKRIKCSMDKEKIEDLIYLREKQLFELGKTNWYNRKDDPVVFKEITNIGGHVNQPAQLQETKQNDDAYGFKTYGKLKKKKMSKSEQKDIFLEKMLIHAKSVLRKQGEYLINPSKQKLQRNMLLKKGKKQFIIFGNYKNSLIKTQAAFDLSSFSFEKKPQSSLFMQTKTLVSQNLRNNQTFTCGEDHTDLREKSKSKQLAIQSNQSNILYLLRNNFISNFGIQLSTNPSAWQVKDHKGNNLLHLAIRYEKLQVIEMIFKKLAYDECRLLLAQKSNNKRTPLKLAEMMVDRRAMEAIERFVSNHREKQIMEGWMFGKVEDGTV